MTLPLIIGQAPARGSTEVDDYGILVPFQGYSGDRLRRMAGVEDLRDYFLLWNIFDEPAIRQGKGDAFNMPYARARTARMLTSIYKLNPPMIILVGRKVEQAFGFRPGRLLKPRKWRGLTWVTFPHPSGVSHFWNDRYNRLKAERFLRGLIDGQNS